MPQTAYPTLIDLGAWLQDAGFTAAAVANLDLETAAAAGVATFEQATGRKMLAVSQTREFDLTAVNPRGVLDLRADMASLTSVTVSGPAQVLNTDMRLREPNASDRGLPFWALQFARRFYPVVTYPQPSWAAIAVTGLWGYAATIPDDAWQGMLVLAGLELHPFLAQEFSHGALTYQEQDVTEHYGPDPMGSLRDNWRFVAFGPKELSGKPGGGGVVGLYKRVVFGAGGFM